MDGGLKSLKLYLGPCCRLERSWGSIKRFLELQAFNGPVIVCLTIFSSLCLNGNSAVGIVSSTSILDIKTAMTKKKMVKKRWILKISFQFPASWSSSEWLTYLNFLLFKILYLFFWLWSRQRRLLDTWILFLKSQHGIRTWHMCTEPPSQTCIISDIHPSQDHLETRWCSRVYTWTFGCFAPAFQHQGKP